MAVVAYAPRALQDLERLSSFLLKIDAAAALRTARLITALVDTLADHPLIGRPTPPDLRELIISRGKSGYVALYQYNEARDRVLVLAIRHQREVGYASP